MEKQFKLFSVDSIKKDKDSNTFTAIISNNNLDRDGEVLLPQGADTKEFMHNPVVFFNHDYSLPVGKAVRVFKSNGNIKAEVKMAVRPEGFQGEFFPEYLTALINQDVIKGMSVGFQILETRIPSKQDIKQFGKGVKRVITKWVLMEFSIAPLMSNPKTLITDHKGLTNKEFNAKLFGTDIEEEKPVETVVEETVENTEWDIEVSPKEKDTIQEIEIEIKRKTGKIYL